MFAGYIFRLLSLKTNYY